MNKKIILIFALLLISALVFAKSVDFTLNGKNYKYVFDLEFGKQSYNCSSNSEVNICFEYYSEKNNSAVEDLGISYQKKTIDFGVRFYLYPLTVLGNVYNKMQWYWSVSPQFTSLDLPYKQNAYSYESKQYYSYNSYDYKLGFRATYPGIYKASANIYYGLNKKDAVAEIEVKKPVLISSSGVVMDSVVSVDDFSLPYQFSIGNVAFIHNKFIFGLKYTFDGINFKDITITPQKIYNEYKIDSWPSEIKTVLQDFNIMGLGSADVNLIFTISEDSTLLYSRSYKLVWGNPPPKVDFIFPKEIVPTFFVCNEANKFYPFDYQIKIGQKNTDNGLMINFLFDENGNYNSIIQKIGLVLSEIYNKPQNAEIVLYNPDSQQYTKIASTLGYTPEALKHLMGGVSKITPSIQADIYSAITGLKTADDDAIEIMDKYYASLKHTAPEQYVSYFLIKNILNIDEDDNKGFFVGPLSKSGSELVRKNIVSASDTKLTQKLLVTYLYYDGIKIVIPKFAVFFSGPPKIKMLKPVLSDWASSGKINICSLSKINFGVPLIENSNPGTKKIERKDSVKLEAEVNTKYDYYYTWYLDDEVIKSGSNKGGLPILDAWDFKLDGKLVPFDSYDLNLEVCYSANILPGLEDYLCGYYSVPIEIVPAIGVGLFLDLEKFTTIGEDEVKQVSVTLSNNGLTEFNFTVYDIVGILTLDGNELDGLYGPYTDPITKTFDDFKLLAGESKTVYLMLNANQLEKLIDKSYNLKVETQGLNDEFAFAVVSSTKIFKTPGISVYAIILLLFGVGFILSRKVRA